MFITEGTRNVIPSPACSNIYRYPETAVVHDECERPIYLTSLNSSAGLIHAGRNDEQQFTFLRVLFSVSDECALPFAHGSLWINSVSKLSVFYKRDLDIISDWSCNLSTGNPARSVLVPSCMAVSREEQIRTI